MKSPIAFIRDLKVRHKLILIYLFVGLFPLLIVGCVAFNNISNLVTQKEVQNYRRVLSMTTSSLDSDMKVYNNLSNYLSFNNTITNVVAGKYNNQYDLYKELTTNLDPILTGAANFHTDIKSVTIYSRKDIVAHGNTLKPITAIQKKSWYKEALKHDMPYWIVNAKKKEVLNVRTMPLLERQGQVGVLVISLDYDQFFKDWQKLADRTDCAIYITAHNKVIYSRKASNMSTLKFKDMTGQDAQHLSTDTTDESSWKIYYYHANLSFYQKAMQKDVAFLLMLVVLIAVASMVALRAASRFISDRIEALTENAKNIQEGHLEVTVTSDDHDEIGTLIRTFGQMVERIKFLIEEVYDARLKEKNYEMRALQQQINPHFLYNTLSMINFLAIESGQNDISKITLSLSDFYRTALNKGSNILSLADELKNMNAYLAIQQMMHDYEFELDVVIDEGLEEYETPNLILQPIVENAITHGLDLLEDRQGILKVFATSFRDEVYIMVEDNGVGMDEATMHKMLTENSKGYGMRNVNQRIKLLYGEKYGLHIESVVGQGTVVTVILPKKKFVKPQNQ